MPRTPMITVEVRESAYSLLAAIASDQDVQLKGATFNRENGKWRIQLETDVFVALCRYAPPDMSEAVLAMLTNPGKLR